jgi:hypothetical protein
MKIMAIVDRHGLPLSVSTHAANHHEVRLVQRGPAPPALARSLRVHAREKSLRNLLGCGFVAWDDCSGGFIFQLARTLRLTSKNLKKPNEINGTSI